MNIRGKLRLMADIEARNAKRIANYVEQTKGGVLSCSTQEGASSSASVRNIRGAAVSNSRRWTILKRRQLVRAAR